MLQPHRVSGLDASFLSLETTSQPLQVFSVLDLDPSTIPGGYSFDGMRDELASRVQAMPALREKLSKRLLNLDHPVWLADNDFNVDNHLHRVRVQTPVGGAALAEVCGRLAGLPLDRRRPLWEMWVIEGPAGSPRLAVLLKMHHAAADGITFGNLLSPLWSESPRSALPDPIPAPTAAGPLREILDSVVRFARRPLYLAAKVLPAAVAAVVDARRRAAAGRAMAAPFSAPRTANRTERQVHH